MEKEQNLIQEKSYRFALRIAKLAQLLGEEKREFVLSKQVLKSGTSIGANVEEALGAQTKKDFFCKMSIAYKEARETHYWLRLLIDLGLVDSKQGESLREDCRSIERILSKIKITTRKNLDV